MATALGSGLGVAAAKTTTMPRGDRPRVVLNDRADLADVSRLRSHPVAPVIIVAVGTCAGRAPRPAAHGGPPTMAAPNSVSPPLDRVKRAIDLVAPYCDLVERLEVVPPSARVRGLYLKSLEPVLQRVGRSSLYRQYFEGERWSPIRMYPLRDYMIRLAVAGAALHSPERVHTGMRDVWRTNATTFASSLLGRTMLRFLAHDPVRLTEQGLAARRQTFQYGSWSIVHH